MLALLPRGTLYFSTATLLALCPLDDVTFTWDILSTDYQLPHPFFNFLLNPHFFLKSSCNDSTLANHTLVLIAQHGH